MIIKNGQKELSKEAQDHFNNAIEQFNKIKSWYESCKEKENKKEKNKK